MEVMVREKGGLRLRSCQAKGVALERGKTSVNRHQTDPSKRNFRLYSLHPMKQLILYGPGRPVFISLCERRSTNKPRPNVMLRMLPTAWHLPAVDPMLRSSFLFSSSFRPAKRHHNIEISITIRFAPPLRLSPDNFICSSGLRKWAVSPDEMPELRIPQAHGDTAR